MVLEVARQMINVIVDPIFIMMILLIIYMYKRVKVIDTNKAIRMGLMDTLRGILLGILASSILIEYELVIPFSYNLFLLIPIAIAIMLIDVKWGCFSYIIPIFYGLSGITRVIHLKISWFDLPYNKLIALVGALHLLEGILVILHGHEDFCEVPIYKEEGIAKGCSSNKFWPIPLLIFKPSVGITLIPIYAVLGYGDVAFYKTPRQKSLYMGVLLLAYGTLIFIIGLQIMNGKMHLITGMCIMPVLHELLFYLNKRYDKKHI